ncbi:MAG: TraB/GumN family protein [Saprospiraceae bacterium]
MRKIVLFASLLLLQIKSFSQVVLENALLWEISGKNLKESSYLFGTIHIIPKEDYFLPKDFSKAFDKSKTLYLELDMNEMNDMSNLMSIMDKCYMKNNVKLSDLLPKSDYELVKGKIEEMGLPMIIFEKMKPLFLSALTTMGSEKTVGGDMDNMKSYEMEFTSMANEKNIPLKGIETMEFQLSIFDSIPYEVQAKSLAESFKTDDKKSDDSMKGLIEFYKSQNINKLSSTIETSEESLKPYMDMMLKNRNKSWIPILSSAMADGPCLFAVGAGHLGGDDGVLNLLKKEGYKIKPLK